MDAMTARLVDFALRAEYSSLSAETVHECKRRLIDTIASALGAYDEKVSAMARDVARRYSGVAQPTARAWGCNWSTAPEAAAFANGTMLRYLDVNDEFGAKSVGHPSDMIAAILAVGEAVHADGPAIINAVTLAYDVWCTFCESIDVNIKGWDHPMYVVLGCTVAVGKLMRLTQEQMGDALALALTPNLAMLQTRKGQLSHWKACSSANAGRNAVFAAFLAKDGFTGPTEVFEGKCGLWDIVGKFDWNPAVDIDGQHRIRRTNIKYFPAGYHTQAPAWVALELRPQIDIEEIKSIDVETYEIAFRHMAGDPSRWAPKTRETADHSIPYVIALALMDGEVTSRSFDDDRRTSPKVLELMSRIKVTIKPEFTAVHPESAPCRIAVTLNSGKVVVSELSSPKGHRDSPFTDQELEGKFRLMCRDYGDEKSCAAILRGLWDLEKAKDISAVLDTLILPSRASA